MKVVSKNSILIKRKRHDFDNEFSYVEVWSNSKLKDYFFAEREFLYPDGTIKSGGRKYFYCPRGCEIEKTTQKINCDSFSDFDRLFFYNESGEVVNIKQI